MSAEPIVRIVHGAAEAQRTILARKPLEEYQAPPALQGEIARLFGTPLSPDEVVARIVWEVRERGDAALAHYARLLDGAEPEALRVPVERLDEAWERTPADLRQALTLAAERIADFHRRQPGGTWLDWHEDGGALGQMVLPLQRVGIYAPHGRVPYPSSLLMAAVPARIAGVPEVVVATPPREGRLSNAILAAARVAGVHEVYAMGGAQAIAALAYGTETVRPVDKILGPGNIFVVLAKRRVYGRVDIDQLPGPTETLLVADEAADPVYCAADMLAQAEHDPMATALLITTSAALAERVQSELAAQLGELPHPEAAAASLAERGGIAVVADLDQALELANDYAPEHLCLLTRNPWELVGRVRHAGGVFVGEWSSEALGDYVLGPSHIMPTGRTARFSSPVNVRDFQKITSIFAAGPETVRAVSDAGICLAEREGLHGHARAMRLRRQRLQREERS